MLIHIHRQLLVDFLCTSLVLTWTFNAVIADQWRRTVKIGIILDNDLLSDEIEEAVVLAMTVANLSAVNNSQSLRLYPLIERTNISESFRLRQAMCSLMEEMPFAMFGLSRSLSYSIIQSYSQALNMPFITPFLTRGTQQETYNYEICLYPSFVEPVIDFIKYFQWKRVFYLFDSDDALWRLQRIYKAFNDSRPQFLADAIRIPDINNSRDVLRKLDRNYNFPTKKIIVDLSSIEAYDAFLSQIIDVGMNRDGYHYVLGTLAMLDLKDLWSSFSHGGVNITGFQLINQQNLYYRKVKLRMNQALSTSERKEMSVS
ncbi:hypothetical protein CHS0354_023656, partial [Potamilus streckersoni]